MILGVYQRSQFTDDFGLDPLDVYAIDTTGALDQYHTVLGSGAWSVYQVLPASMNLTGGVGGVMNGSTVELFTTDSSGDLIQVEKTPTGSWNAYLIAGSSGYYINDRPSVVWGSSSVNVFADSTTGALLQYSTTIGSGTWNVYQVLPTSMGLQGGTSVAQVGSDTNVFSTDANGNVIQMVATNGSWSAYNITSLSGSTVASTGTPGLIWGSSSVNVFSEGRDGSLQQFSTTSGGAWTTYPNVEPASLHLIGGDDASVYGSTTEVFGVAASSN